MSDELQKSAPAENNNIEDISGMLLPCKIPKVVQKLLVIAGALLLLQIPLYFTETLVNDRSRSYNTTLKDIQTSWGDADLCIWPPERNNTYPEKYDLSIDINAGKRYRGIYQCVVFNGNVNIKAIFAPFAAKRKIQVNHPKAKNFTVTVNGKKVPVSAIAAGHEFEIPETEKGPAECLISYQFRGVKGVNFRNFSKVKITGNWGAPSFTGSILPDKRVVSDNTFEAEWDLSAEEYCNANIAAGVDFYLPVSDYAVILRSLRYATFFLVIFFFAFIAAEIFCKEEIHPMQYLVASLSPVLFYIMLLAFSEKCGFVVSYIISMATVVGLTVFYARLIFERFKPALILGGLFAVAYGINYIILRMEDMALITGSVVLAVILAFLMYLTGKLNRPQMD